MSVPQNWKPSWPSRNRLENYSPIATTVARDAEMALQAVKMSEEFAFAVRGQSDVRKPASGCQ